MSAATLPNYVAVSREETGENFNLSWDDYRRLAKTALVVTENLETVMGVYRCDGGCALDIWCGQRCLTIQVDSELGSVSLWLAADIDCGLDPLCLFRSGNSAKEWNQLTRFARKAI